MKTDLKKVLSISGKPGLYNYISQARTGVIVESLNTKSRSCFGLSFRITSLADISIFTDEDEVKLQDVFESMHKFLGEEKAPSAKGDVNELVKFFEQVLPNYDRDRFYTSHMKKVVDWYNCLKEFASLDFEEEK